MKKFDVAKVFKVSKLIEYGVKAGGLGAGVVGSKWLVHPNVAGKVLTTPKAMRWAPAFPLVTGVAINEFFGNELRGGLKAFGDGLIAQQMGTIIGRWIDPTGARGLNGEHVMLNGEDVMMNGHQMEEDSYTEYSDSYSTGAPSFSDFQTNEMTY